jgi:hypothetical protein
MARDANNLPSAFAASRYSGLWPGLEPQKTQSELNEAMEFFDRCVEIGGLEQQSTVKRETGSAVAPWRGIFDAQANRGFPAPPIAHGGACTYLGKSCGPSIVQARRGR